MSKILKYTALDSFTTTRFLVGGSSTSGLLRIGELDSNPSTHTWKTPLLEIESGSSVNFKVATLDETHFVVAYSDGVTGYGTVRAGHWDEASSIDWDTPETLFQHTPSLMSENTLDLIKLSSVCFAIVYIAEDDNHKIKIRIGQISSNTVVWLTTSEFIVDTNCSWVSLKLVTGFRFLVSYETSDVIYVRLYNWLGGNNLVALSDPTLVNSGTASHIYLLVMSDSRFLVFWASSSQGLMRVGSIDGSNIGWVTATQEFLDSQCEYLSAVRLTDLYFAVSCRDVIDNGYGKVRAGYWNGASIVWLGTIITFRHTSIKYLSMLALGEHLFLILYCDEGFSQCGVLTKCRLGSLISTTTTTASTTTTTTTTTVTTTTLTTTTSGTTESTTTGP
jgi:hypothetical protein